MSSPVTPSWLRARATLSAVTGGVVLAALLHTGTAVAAPAGAGPAPAAAAVTAGGTAFGSTVQLRSGEVWEAGIARVERVVGRLKVVRIFQNEPRPSILSPLGGRSGVISFRVPPDQVLSGRYDQDFRAFFAAAPRDHQTWWSYYHEADVAHQHGRLPDLDQYRRAYTRVAQLARNAHNDQLRNALILVDYTANPQSGLRVSMFMPRADLVDVVAWDDYNGWFTRKGVYGDPTDMIELNRRASAAVGKPFAIAEFGSLVIHHDTAGRAAWITKFARVAYAKGARFVSYYDSDHYGSSADYRLLDVPSQRAYHAVVSDQRP